MSIQIAEIRGIPIKLHFTLLIVFFLVSWTLATGFMPQRYPDLDATQYWIMGMVGAVILFISVLLHELSHSLVAIKFGIKVRQIVLFIFGGVSDIEEEPKDFRREFRIAFAGPITSFILSGLFAASWWMVASFVTGVSGLQSSSAVMMVEGILFYGMILNAILGVFNLLPAFPMDGGRILRALLMRKNRDFDQATKIAVRVGIAMSYVFFGVGFMIMISGSFITGIWILLIGWFLQSGAQSYLYQHDIMSILAKVKLREIMNTRVIAVGEDVSVDTLIKDYFSVYMKSALPVIGNNGRLKGMVMIRTAMGVPEHQRSSMTVKEIMISREHLVVMEPDRSADEALLQMTRKGIGKVFVCDPDDRVVGVVSKTDIMDAAGERQEYIAASGYSQTRIRS
jgi:Zn-dependent protease/predicted transcriptional regulator